MTHKLVCLTASVSANVMTIEPSSPCCWTKVSLSMIRSRMNRTALRSAFTQAKILSPLYTSMDFDKELMTLVVHGATVPMIRVDETAWFKAKDCASVLGYKDTKKSIKAHVEEEWQQTLESLLQVGGG